MGPHAGVFLRMKVRLGEFELDADLNLPGRGITALWGPSGSGKTTLLRAVSGLLESRRSRIRINGERWQDADLFLPPHRRAVGYVLRETRLFEHLDVHQNIAFGMHRVEPAKRRGSLTKIVDTLGIGHLLPRRVSALGRVDRQRIGIARAMATSPQLLLMDEPLSALDPDSRREILPLLARLQEDTEVPMLYVTRSFDEMTRLAHHVVVMDQGRLVDSGSLAEMLLKAGQPLSQDEEALSILYGVVDSLDSAYGLAHVKFPGGTLRVPHRGDLARGEYLRLRVPASAVSVTLEPPKDSSILNSVPARVLARVDDGPGRTMLRLGIGSSQVLARISRRSERMLALEAGMDVHAQVKGTSILC